MGKWATLMAIIGMLLCLIAPAEAQQTEEARYDLLYSALSADDKSYSIEYVNAVSGQMHEVGTLNAYGSDAGWSPKGQFIYLVNITSSKTLTLTLVNMDDGSHQVVTDNMPANGCAAPLWWSPDDHFLVYFTADHERYTINIFDTQQKTVQTLPDTVDFFLYTASWSPDGRYFAYTAETSTTSSRIKIWDAQEIRLRYEMDTDSLLWSPAEDRAAYQSSDGDSIILNILDGSERHFTASGFDGWSDDGRYLKVYIIEQDASARVGLVDSHSNREPVMRKLDGQFLYSEGSMWSPDGRYLIYETLDAKPEAAVYDVLNDSSTALVSNELIESSDAEWSPDGHWVAFPQKWSDVVESLKSFWIFDIDDQKQQHFDSAVSKIHYDRVLQWSPDKEHLMVWAENGIKIFDRADWELHPIEDNGIRVTTPRWSSDGRYLAFEKRSDTNIDIGVVDTQDYQTRDLMTTPEHYETILGWRGSGENESLIFCGEG